MKKLYIPFLILVLAVLPVRAQITPDLLPNQGYVGGGLGMTWIDGEPHYSMQFFPEFSFGQIGFGLNLNLDFDANGKLREENFNEFTDYLALIRYVRYGFKDDPLYARLGALDYATLGHGSIMYMYNNSPSFDARRIGLAFDMDFTQLGFETVYGNFAQDGVIGGRFYIRPLQFTDARSIPIIGKLETGFTLVSDFNKYADVTSVNYNPQTDEFEPVNDGSVTIWGLDIGLPLLSTGLLNWEIYFDYSNIVDYGNGTATGTILQFNGLGLVDLRAKLERRFNNDNYLPSYFNMLYEVERFSMDPETGSFSSKANRLKNLESPGNGYYGELMVSIINTFRILGSYQRLDDDPKSGILHLGTKVAPEGMPFVLQAGYDKVQIEDEKDIFTLDDRSYMFAEFGYKPNRFMLVSLMYRWTFEPVRGPDDNIVDYEPQRRVEPRISFIYPFDM